MGVSKLHGKIAKAAVCVALSGSMALGGVIMPITQAFADTVATGGVMLKVGDAGAVTAPKAYQVFSGTVTNGAMTSPSWASKMEDTVVTFLINGKAVLEANEVKKNASGETIYEKYAGEQYVDWLISNNYLPADYTDIEYRDATHDPRNALSFISERISSSDGAYDDRTGVKATKIGSFANEFADIVRSVTDGTTADNFANGSAKTLNTGYWLFTAPDGDYVPMWLPIETGKVIEASVKVAPSTIEKSVSDKTNTDGAFINHTAYVDTGSNRNVGDANHVLAKSRDCIVQYKLSVNLATEGKDFLITDTLPAGIDMFSGEGAAPTANLQLVSKPTDSTLVTGRTLSPDDFYVNYQDHVLTIRSTNTGKAKLKKGNYVFTYTAKINDDATIGLGKFNVNRVVLTYNKDTSVEKVANVTSYKIKLNCIDDNNKAGLQGATFTIQRSDGYYLQGDGTWRDNTAYTSSDNRYKYTFVADDKGEILTPFVDNTEDFDQDGDGVIQESEKWLTITEAGEPTGYTTLLAANTVTDDGLGVSGGHQFQIRFGQAFDSETGEAVKNYTIQKQKDGTAGKVTTQPNLEEGIMEITIPHTKAINLPITGMTPSQLGTIVGGALMALGAIFIAKRRNDDPEQA